MAHKKAATRRGNNEGSIYQRKDGRWAAQVTVGLDDNGKPERRYIYGASRAEVAVKLTGALGHTKKGGHASALNDDLQIIMREWLMTFKQASVAPRTFEKSLTQTRLFIYPQIGEMKIHDITTFHIQRLLNRMQMDDYALDTVKHAKHLLRQFFEYCVDSGFIDKNPVNKVKLQSRERKIVTDEQYKAIPIDIREKFLDALGKSALLRPICMTAMFAGLRIGEVLALKWKDIDFENGIIHVNNAITSDTKYDKDGNVLSRKTVISDTKTAASVREAPIMIILTKALEEWKKERWLLQKKCEEQGKNISFLAPNDLAFSTNEGQLRSYYGTHAMFDRFLKDNGLGGCGIHFHTLRHTFSSMLFEMGENPKVIQMLLGHKDVTTTIRTYNSVDRSFFKQTINKLNDRFDKPDFEM
jgi:integrase